MEGELQLGTFTSKRCLLAAPFAVAVQPIPRSRARDERAAAAGVCTHTPSPVCERTALVSALGRRRGPTPTPIAAPCRYPPRRHRETKENKKYMRIQKIKHTEEEREVKKRMHGASRVANEWETPRWKTDGDRSATALHAAPRSGDLHTSAPVCTWRPPGVYARNSRWPGSARFSA